MQKKAVQNLAIPNCLIISDCRVVEIYVILNAFDKCICHNMYAQPERLVVTPWTFMGGSVKFIAVDFKTLVVLAPVFVDFDEDLKEDTFLEKTFKGLASLC